MDLPKVPTCPVRAKQVIGEEQLDDSTSHPGPEFFRIFFVGLLAHQQLSTFSSGSEGSPVILAFKGTGGIGVQHRLCAHRAKLCYATKQPTRCRQTKDQGGVSFFLSMHEYNFFEGKLPGEPKPVWRVQPQDTPHSFLSTLGFGWDWFWPKNMLHVSQP